MPLNQLENFIKNTEGRILYVNPNDLDSTDSIVNQGNSLTKPFKTIQRALIESARFSYLRGRNNDITEKTTILLFPGEHVIDNRPGFAIREEGDPSYAEAVAPWGATYLARDIFNLTLTSNFDLTQTDNVLFKFNSVEGGVIVPRGTSIVGLDLRKVKIRPKYVPNPTDPLAPKSAIFRVTGACYFWQASFFDGDELGVVYTDPQDFGLENRSNPTFSHHKLTCFEYADGVNTVDGYTLTDLEMYYAKLSNAYNEASGRLIPFSDKYPASETGIAPQRPEFEIVGAFASDSFKITSIQSGNGLTASNIITVTTAEPHGFSPGTPIKIRGVSTQDYNISTKVAEVDDEDPSKFTYLLPFVRSNLPAFPSASAATVTIETDTVSGASPYIFNCSLRSVWGMNGLHADGSKATGFRSMVTAQFTAISLQKDDRSFVKYDPIARVYNGLDLSNKVIGAELSSQASSTDSNTVYHLDPRAVYRPGWETSHIKLTNDSFIQVVSVFAIGFTKHFDSESGGDASITNSNSNFGQYSLAATGYKAEAFDKDDRAYVTSIIGPRANVKEEENIDWISLDIKLTDEANNSNHLYIYGFKNPDVKPPIILQQYRLGAKVNDKIFVDTPDGVREANIYMVDNTLTTVGVNSRALGNDSSEKYYRVNGAPSLDNRDPLEYPDSYTVFDIGAHSLQTGEKVRLFSDNGDIPENLVEHRLYYTIKYSSNEIQLASSRTNAQVGVPIICYGGSNLSIVSRVSDKEPGDVGSPVQYDLVQGNWFVNTNASNQIYSTIKTYGAAGFGTDRTEVSFIKRIPESRSLDEKLYKLRVVIPRESENARDPLVGFILQESSSTGITTISDFTANSIVRSAYNYKRNWRFITNCTVDSTTVTVLTDLPHGLKSGDVVTIRNVTSNTNLIADQTLGYNGKFEVTSVVDNFTFTYETTDVFGRTRNPGTFTNNIHIRNDKLPRFEKSDIQSNYYIYRNEVIIPFIYGVQDGIYHLYVLNASNKIEGVFEDLNFAQTVVDLYPQLDNDNVDDNPPAASSYAKRKPIGQVVTNDLKKSLTRETVDKFVSDFDLGFKISGVSTSFSSPTSGTATLTFNKDHSFGGIATYSSITPGSGYDDGTYYNVKLFNLGSSVWDGATAKVTVSLGSVAAVDIIAKGSGYTNGEFLEFDPTVIGPSGSGGQIQVLTSGLSGDIGDGVQITGIGTTSDGYYKITAIPATNQVAIAITNAYPQIISGQYAFPTGPSVTISSQSYDPITKLTTFNFSAPHGLVLGNKFRIFTSSNQSLGDFFVDEKLNGTSLTAITNKDLSVAGGYIIKHALATNDGISDVSGESLGTRGMFFYDSESTYLTSELTPGDSALSTPITQGQMGRFPVGSFIQVDNEIMRIASNNLNGFGQIQVHRGYLGTRAQGHSNGTLVKKIKPIPIEFRRPSILRASGHTFEYLGYGPGNYSTGLPQVQVAALTEVEAFLSQSQQRSCGNVAYTGMNSDGDFFIGNTKYSSTSGAQITYGIPIPTVTGRDPSRLSVIFDEVVIKERLIVEGGNSGTILSQFDGPVTFNGELRINGYLTINNGVRIRKDLRVDGRSRFDNDVTINSLTDASSEITSELLAISAAGAALIVKGGVGIVKDLVVNKNTRITGITTLTGLLDANGGATIDNVRIGIADNNRIDTSTGNLTLDAATDLVVVNSNFEVTGFSTFTRLLDANDGATIDNIQIGVTDDNRIDTSTGNLILDSFNKNVFVDDNLFVTQNVTVTGISTFNSLVDAKAGGEFSDNIRIGVTDFTRIDTKIGDLTLDSSSGFTVIVDDYLVVNEETFMYDTLTVTKGDPLADPSKILVNTDGNIELYRSGAGGAYIDFKRTSPSENYNVRLDNFVDGTLTLTGTLSVTEDVILGNEFEIDTVTFNSKISTSLVPTTNGTLNIGENTSRWGTVFLNNLTASSANISDEAYIDDIQIGVTGSTTIDTASGTLVLNAQSGIITLQSSIILGDATSDTITFNARVNSDFVPSTDNTRSLGTTLLRWSNVFARTVGQSEYTTFNGFGTIPVGGIIMWSGTTVPAGWALCNGANETPNLSGRFIVASGGGYNLNSTGGSASLSGTTSGHALTRDQIPPHRHGIDHGHPANTINDPGHSHTYRIRAEQDGDGDGGGGAASSLTGYNYTTSTQTTGISISPIGDIYSGRGNQGGAPDGLNTIGVGPDSNLAAEHSHSVTGSTIPPYYALAYIMRIL
jgi:hypothetical protein